MVVVLWVMGYGFLRYFVNLFYYFGRDFVCCFGFGMDKFNKRSRILYKIKQTQSLSPESSFNKSI